MKDFLESNADEICICSAIFAIIAGVVSIIETLVVGWHFWSIFFAASVVATVFYITSAVCFCLYREYVFDEPCVHIPAHVLSGFLLVVLILNILVILFSISIKVFVIAIVLVVGITTTILVAIQHKKQIQNSKE